MKIQFDPIFLEKLKTLDVRIRKNFKERILIFEIDHQNPILRNHQLKNEYKRYRSINITNDYRAIYEEVVVGKTTIAYFIIIETHRELYG